MLTLLLPLLLLLGNISFFADVKAANIVFFSPTGSYSHRVSVWPLVGKLVENGHHITFISAYPPKDPLPNVTEIVPEQMAKSANDFMQGGELDVSRRISGEMEACYDHVPQLGIDTCKMFLDDPEVQAWLKTGLKIDLLVVDWFVSDCILGLAYKHDAPFIFYAPTVMVGYLYEAYGFLPDTAGVPDFERHFTPPMTFLERMNNELQPLIWKYKMGPYFDELSKLVREKLDIPDMPPLENIVRNASLMLWSESVIEGYAHTLPPNWITVGGMHCKEDPEPLPKDLEKIVQKGKDGFIYISFGSAVVPGNLPKSYIDAFFNAIKEFPQIQFLWKWTGKLPIQKVPDNLYIGSWFPQQDLLGFAHENENLVSIKVTCNLKGDKKYIVAFSAHKRILTFVTQAGRPSTQEAIFHGVPIISLPVFEDQDYTADRVRDMGGGIVLEIATITKEEFQGAIKDITTDQKYKKTMQRLSTIFRDRPMKPADTALYWTEYVLRHKGDLSHLRPASYNLTWYQRRQLDVWAVFISAALLLLAILIYVGLCCIKLAFRFICSSNTNENKNLSKKKRL